MQLRSDMLKAIRLAYRRERNAKAKDILKAIIQNALIARRERLAICQDTGLPCVFIELGEDVKIIGNLKSAVNKGVESGYRRGNLRDSIVRDPLSREKFGYSPAVIHIEIVKGNKIKLTVLPKGFGCENKSRLIMLNPTSGIDKIKKYVLETIKFAGADACPPFVVGVGIGGTADYACFLAKKALLKKIKNQKIPAYRQAGKIKILERELLKAINKLNIGPMGLGGKTTALAVNILTYPTHIAGLPVAVNISCHALRSATKSL